MRRTAAFLSLFVFLGCSADPTPPGDELGQDDGKEDELGGTALGSKLPDPNAAEPPAASWKPPAVSSWPDAYVIFNNTGCGQSCTQADQNALQGRAVMIKMLNAAIRSVKSGGTIRISNFNISSAAALDVVEEALKYAMTKKKAKVKIAMDPAQDVPDSRTNALAALGADVRYSIGVRPQTAGSTGAAGILHSKMVVVDDKVVLSGSNNFSGSGLITNEENSVVLHGAGQKARILAYRCAFDRMFDAGVPPGAAQLADGDAKRKKAIAGIDACETEDMFFPPSGVTTDKRSHAFDAVSGAIAAAEESLDISPDLMSHPGLVSAIAKRARAAREAGKGFKVRLLVDGSQDALELPAFGECLTDVARRDDLDVEVRYWLGNEDIFQLLHHKFMVVDAAGDDGALWNGSANYSAKALKWSWENVVRYPASDYGDLVEIFEARFERTWKSGKPRAKLESEDGIKVPDCPMDLADL